MSRLDPATWPQTYPNGPGHTFGSATSRAAAETIKPKLGRLHEIVLEIFQRAGDEGLTDERLDIIVKRMFQNKGTVRPRRIELTAQGRIKDSGRTRPTESGRQAAVWVLVT